MIQLADWTVKQPMGVLEDVPLKVGKFNVPCDFIVMDMREDRQTPLILWRPFLKTLGALFEVKNGRMSFTIGEKR